ncbi:MAG: hypothetical protein DCC68_00565 [Planctomycetota bacterium]|nr:MAG: hypothetical protein DCC68_00565 [Planctomycetota bacterium]
MIEFAKIVLLCVAAAVAYGVIHDQFTIRVCLEYFTVGHPPIFAHLPTTLHAAAWGVFATWWLGLVLGLLAGLLSRVGSWPKLAAKDLSRPVCKLLAAMAIGSAVAGVVAYGLATRGVVRLFEPFATEILPTHHSPFIACAAAHSVSYLLATFGGLLICTRIPYLRWKAAKR